MKKTLAILFLSFLFVTGASAQFAGPGSHDIIRTVEQAQGARRGDNAVLKGSIVKHLRGTYYLFRDSTGEIRVAINRLVWQGRRLTSTTRVRLTGRIDRDVREIYINVRRLDVVK